MKNNAETIKETLNESENTDSVGLEHKNFWKKNACCGECKGRDFCGTGKVKQISKSFNK